MSLLIRGDRNTNPCKACGGSPNCGQRSCTGKMSRASGTPEFGSTSGSIVLLIPVAWCILRLKNGSRTRTFATNHAIFRPKGRCCNKKRKCTHRFETLGRARERNGYCRNGLPKRSRGEKCMSVGLDKLKHIVVLMMENRSFDHMLGGLKAKDPRINGLSGNEANPDSTGALIKVQPLADYQDQLNDDPDHHFPGTDLQIFGDQQGARRVANMQGFIKS